MDPSKKEINLLLVDDEEEFLDATAASLGRRGIVVSPAKDGYTALRLLEKQPIDVAVLDVKMPGIDGVTLFRRIKKMRPNLPVIMLTGHGTVQQAFSTSKEGVFDYLAKPCDIQALAELVQRAAALVEHTAPGDMQLPSPNIRLLLVDSNPRFLSTMSEALRRLGLQVTPASGRQAVQRAMGQEHFDVALVETKSSADQVLWKGIKAADPLIQIILLSDKPQVDAAVAGVKEGVCDFLVKPQKVEVLAERIGEAWEVRQRRSEQERRQNLENLLLGKAD